MKSKKFQLGLTENTTSKKEFEKNCSFKAASAQIFPTAEVLQWQLVGQGAFLSSVGGRPPRGRHLLSELGWRSSARAWACLLLSSRTPTDNSRWCGEWELGVTATQEQEQEEQEEERVVDTDRGWSLGEEVSSRDLVSFTTTTTTRTAFGEVDHPPPPTDAN